MPDPTDHRAAAHSHLTMAESMVYGDKLPVDLRIQLAQTHALLAISDSLAALVIRDAPQPIGGATTTFPLSPEEAKILAMPRPKGYECPACRHADTSHRMHGCDVGGCDCPCPHGRVLPADPDPTKEN